MKSLRPGSGFVERLKTPQLQLRNACNQLSSAGLGENLLDSLEVKSAKRCRKFRDVATSTRDIPFSRLADPQENCDGAPTRELGGSLQQLDPAADGSEKPAHLSSQTGNTSITI